MVEWAWETFLDEGDRALVLSALGARRRKLATPAPRRVRRAPTGMATLPQRLGKHDGLHRGEALLQLLDERFYRRLLACAPYFFLTLPTRPRRRAGRNRCWSDPSRFASTGSADAAETVGRARREGVTDRPRPVAPGGGESWANNPATAIASLARAIGLTSRRRGQRGRDAAKGGRADESTRVCRGARACIPQRTTPRRVGS